MKMKPCPFCGKDAARIRILPPELYRVECSNIECGVIDGGLFTTKEEAIRHWNRRPDMWRPIGSAPRDGRAFLGAFSGGILGLCRWSEALRRFTSAQAGAGFNSLKIQPTHWMPVPDPPDKEDDVVAAIYG